MSRLGSRVFVLAALIGIAAAVPARAGVAVDFGISWDGPSNSLQSIINARYGAGRIDVVHDYIGAKAADPDPFFWVDRGFSALLVREVAGNANRNLVGWYIEPANGSPPVIDGVNDGVVFDGPSSAGATSIVSFPQPAQHFGFYLNPNGPLDATNAPEPEKFFTNRLFNDRGPDGKGALHAPFDGDVQAIVFDVSRFTHMNTWLVCFEDLDSGANPGPCGGSSTDNDFNDFVFEVTAISVTPVQPLSFGGLKIKYR
jgi:uncharacterized protein DUF4114